MALHLKSPTAHRPLILVPLLLSAMAISGCRPIHSWISPPVHLQEVGAENPSVVLPEEWWTSFDDPALDALIAKALEGNFSLRVAWDRLAQSRAIAEKSNADFWPHVDGSGDAGRSVNRNEMGRAYTTDFSLGVLASYEVDLWGRVRATSDAASLDISASEQDVHAAAITLTADIARTWYQLVEQRKQRILVQEQIDINIKYLDAITLQFRRGLVLATDVLQQRQLVESTRGDAILIESNIKVLEHRLAVLVGQPPSTFPVDETQHTLPALPAFPEGGLPSEWLRRRPDVQVAEIRVRSADRRVAAAIADQFPRLSLTANASTSAENIRNLFDNWLAGLAANLVGPIFDGGQRRAEVRRTEAVISERINEYGQIVLEALQDVEDAQTNEAKQADYVQSVQKQLDLAEKSKVQTLQNYANGTVDFTRYLTTILSYQQLQRSSLQAQRDLVLYRIDLYRALAGDWELPVPPQAVIPDQTNEESK